MTADPREAFRSAMLAAVIAFVLQAVFVPVDTYVLGAWPIAWLDGAHALWAAAFAGWLWTHRKKPRVWVCEAAFASVMLPFLPIMWVGELMAMRQGLIRDPMMPFQFAMLGVALLAPASAWLGGALLAVFAASALVFWARLEAEFSLAHLPGEPWMMLVYGGVAAGFLVARVHLRKVVRELSDTRAEANALARVARLFLAVRDRTNSPLQSLEFGVALLSRRHPEEDRLMEAMRRSLGRLRHLSSLLAVAEKWRKTDNALDVDLDSEIKDVASPAKGRNGPPRERAARGVNANERASMRERMKQFPILRARRAPSRFH
ncbi:MAG: hypothetical protein HOW73_04935 [Polyangiaceae bacterium]|nr:hypothetical protein [Polyangiaceae bacterium]